MQLSRDLILDATWQSLREHGYDGTTIRRIASLLNCSVGSIYRYFTDKHELLLAVTQQMLAPALHVLEGGEGFESSVRVYHDNASRHPEAYRLMFWLTALQDKSQGPDNGQLEAPKPLPPVVAQIVEHWARHLGDPTLAYQAWALLHGAVMIGQPAESVLQLLGRLSNQHPVPEPLPPTPEERFLSQ